MTARLVTSNKIGIGLFSLWSDLPLTTWAVIYSDLLLNLSTTLQSTPANVWFLDLPGRAGVVS